MRLLVLLTICAYVKTQDYNDLVTLALGGTGDRCGKRCDVGYSCEVQQCRCEVCIKDKPTCKTLNCAKNEKCVDTPAGPVCKPLTCNDIYCAAGELCNELPDGPDCVPDVPSCEGFYCRRGTNCYVRGGSPICLPNTCMVRVCEPGLTCIDTVDGALCRRGTKTGGCEGRYCPTNSKCVDEPPLGPHCALI
ncbi:spore coat protein SP60-like [Pollicipes pollicipes]|uniref:spore coat protein SP60-like n=1 Tax=Pollicipes pollicipes TaxID=41117 RepID=UPI001884AFA5|nr:spore coat protein SP60-like [Pollicipes pollicipes]XP_037071985.1 spore coat protein SP60-like [Pollicipes pollicipes]